MQEVVIIGGKGTAINLAEQIEDARVRFGYPMRVYGFAIDDPALGQQIAGFPVLCGTQEAARKYIDGDVQFLFALYRPDVMAQRVRLRDELAIPPAHYATFVHPAAYVAPSVRIGHGSVVFAQSNIMSGVTIGCHVVINSGVSIEHDTEVGDSVFAAAGAVVGSFVKLGRGTFLGLGTTIREKVVIGDFAFVGMGSVVLEHVPNTARVYGIPARVHA